MSKAIKLIGIIGSFASIIGLLLYFLPRETINIEILNDSHNSAMSGKEGGVDSKIGNHLNIDSPKIFDGYWTTEGDILYKGQNLSLDIQTFEGKDFGAMINENYRFNLNGKMTGQVTAEFEISYLSGVPIEKITHIGKGALWLENLDGVPRLQWHLTEVIDSAKDKLPKEAVLSKHGLCASTGRKSTLARLELEKVSD